MLMDLIEYDNTCAPHRLKAKMLYYVKYVSYVEYYNTVILS